MEASTSDHEIKDGALEGAEGEGGDNGDSDDVDDFEAAAVKLLRVGGELAARDSRRFCSREDDNVVEVVVETEEGVSSAL